MNDFIQAKAETYLGVVLPTAASFKDTTNDPAISQIENFLSVFLLILCSRTF